MRIYYTLLTFLLFYSCSNTSFHNENPFYNSLKGSYTLSKKYEKKIPLDTLSDAFILSYEINQGDKIDNEAFIFLNKKTNSIYFYNWEKSELDSILTLPTQGPSGVGSINGFNYINKDSIFLFAQNYTISLVNRKGEVLSRKKMPIFREMPEGKRIYNPSIEVTGISPMHYKDNKIFFSGNIDAEFDDFSKENSFSMTLVDLNSEKLQFILPFPEIYYSGNWLGAKFRKSFTTYNEIKNEIIISYPSSHQLSKYDINNGSIEKKFGASNFSNIIVPMKGNFSDQTSLEKWSFFLGSDSYGPVIWDKYRKLYYRVLLKGRVNVDNLTGKGDIYKNMSVIILNEDFSYMGETELPGSIYDNNTFFVTKDGLVAYNYAAYKKNENYLAFDVFELKKH
ncbi:DUF4221 family protein [uncultured Cyclobacterium sp.]|uniref:DUF4221 family protein n=1 Tax=uncultured Cyclobacterium sp. TaxID=453820 RepID=UPI0030ED236D|tara:strand:- start:5833 stop:7014 length:1182 start_codon:yes stop_codon:yes gene_type:complete